MISTWIGSGSSWSQTSPESQDQPTSFAYDPLGHQLVGFDGAPPTSGEVLNRGHARTWLFNGTNWLKPAGLAEPSKANGVLATAPGGSGVVLFESDGQTWIFHDTWRRLRVRGTTPRIENGSTLAMVDDTGLHADVLVVAASQSASADQTWTFDGYAWHRGPPTP